MHPLLDPCGGYRKLDAFLMASLIQLETRAWCERFLNHGNDPKGRQYDQMTQAARSGRANIMEGSQRAATSKADEMKLMDVARASLVELMGDYEMALLSRGKAPWALDSPEARAVADWRFAPHGDWSDPVHDSCVYLLEQRHRLAPLISEDEARAANVLLILCRRTVGMLTHLLRRQGEMFAQSGGFRERMTATRLAVRDAEAPTCPKCGAAMRKRTARSGPRSGMPFWGCSRWPTCDGRREEGNAEPPP